LFGFGRRRRREQARKRFVEHAATPVSDLCDVADLRFVWPADRFGLRLRPPYLARVDAACVNWGMIVRRIARLRPQSRPDVVVYGAFGRLTLCGSCFGVGPEWTFGKLVVLVLKNPDVMGPEASRGPSAHARGLFRRHGRVLETWHVELLAVESSGAV
jgi:hypothetical protein